MFKILKRKIKTNQPFFLPLVDIHSHILPGIDDGAATLDDSLSMIEELYSMGYRQLIATPHIYKAFYSNTGSIILDKLSLVRNALANRGIDIKLDAAAEYFLDDHFNDLLQKDDILTLPGGFVLIEMSFMAMYPHLRQTLFEMQLKGYKPILAHPERYPYLNQNMLANLVDGGCRLQVNLLSFIGRYGKGPQLSAEQMIRNKLVSMVGTDVHHMHDIDLLHQLQGNSSIRRLLRQYEFENPKLSTL